MISPASLVQILKSNGVEIFVGVPDSLLKSLCAWLADHSSHQDYIITANEGNAVALAAGYHLATGKIGAVFMQNSGIGNSINPLTSLTDSEVYSIPMLLIIGWRGQPGIKDEPQHIKQGRITPGQLELLEIPYKIMEKCSNPKILIPELVSTARAKNCPAALLVRKNTLSEYQRIKTTPPFSVLGREEALSHILELADSKDLIVSTTGKTSRELFELRKNRGEKQQDFLTVGSMGHTSSIALGVALGKPHRRVICLDGDGSLIMHMGAMPIIGSLKPANFIHILLNNCSHESVGGQETVAEKMDFKAISIACGYRHYCLVQDKNQLCAFMKKINKILGPVFIELRICSGSRDDLGRPITTPLQNKKTFMEFCCD